jgi:hypothetical protein
MGASPEETMRAASRSSFDSRALPPLLISAVTAFLCVVVGVPVSADLIVPLSQTRSIFAEAQVTDFSTGATDLDSNSLSASDFGLFDATVSATASVPIVEATGSASQTSRFTTGSIGPGSEGISGVGSASAASNPLGGIFEDRGQGESLVDVSFSVTQHVTYQLIANLMTREQGPAGLQNVGSFTLRGGPSDEIIVDLFVIADGDAFRILSGSLQPGTYSLRARAFADSGFGIGTFTNFDFEFNVIPEPSTAVLLALGLVGLAAGRRRVSHHATVQRREAPCPERAHRAPASELLHV